MKTFFGYIGCIILFVACGPSASIEKSETADFSGYKTYYWVEENKDEHMMYLSNVQEDNMMNTVNSYLNKLGWTQSNSNPDILLRYDILVEKTIRERNDPVYTRSYFRNFYNPYTNRWVSVYFPSRFLGYDTRQYQSREGTLTISMIDNKNEKVVWQGWTTQQVGEGRLSSNELKRAAEAIMKKFKP